MRLQDEHQFKFTEKRCESHEHNEIYSGNILFDHRVSFSTKYVLSKSVFEKKLFWSVIVNEKKPEKIAKKNFKTESPK